MRLVRTLLTVCITLVLLSTGVIAQQRTVPKPPKLDRYEFKLLPPVAPLLETDYIVIKEDFTLTLRDGAIMDCSKFYPSEPNIYLPNGYPVVLMVHGYGDRKETLEHFATAQAQYNYVTYTYSVRGQGNSGGLSNLMSIVEAEDLMELVDYIKADNVGGDSSRIAITGGSQGGTVPYIAACNGMQVKGIISALTSPRFATSWIDNGCAKMSYLWTIEYTPDSARYNPVVDRMSDWVYASGVKSDKWDSLAYWMPIGRDFDDKVQNNTVPLLVENSWQDYFFNSRDGISSFGNIQPEHIVYMGAVMGHGGDISEAENTWHMQFFNDWFFHNVWDLASGYPSYDRYQLAYTTAPKVGNYWSFEHGSTAVWPPVDVIDKKFYFRKNSKLSSTQEGNANTKVNFENNVAANYSLQTAVYEEFAGTEFNNKFKKDNTVFTSDALTQPTYMVGTPTVNLKYSANANICQYNFQIYELFPNGQEHFVSRINYTDRNYVKNQARTKLIEGNSHAHKFQAGSKIKIVATNFDHAPSDVAFLNTNPHVLPVMTKSKNQIFLKDSYISLPLRTTGGDTFTEEMVSPKLYQNYPNPFNPSTQIKFELPEGFNGMVSLRVYDMVGREVATLVNTNMTEGIHQVNWNAGNFASGVYFSKLIANDQVQVSRMLLIK
jgi:predicted acyl esterase